ncbi:MAG: hypothetical protein HY365_02680 [Candidatus Aenigmarchaeota archaeon]|nr:hypothetical protein [Candidatus Aenigmarchaeota archaeon]
MVEIVLWKPLYYVSIAMFALSLLAYPFSQTFSVVMILVLVSVWSKIPGYVHFVFNKLAMNDLFTFIVGAYLGGLAGGLFGAFVVLFGRIFGVNEYVPYTIRCAIGLFVAGMLAPFAVSVAGGVNINALFIFEGIFYALYYTMVFLFAKDEISLEAGLLPFVVFFDFVLNATWLGSFGGAINNLMLNGISSGWTFIVFAGIILGFIALARNGGKLAGYITAKMHKEENASDEESLLKRLESAKKARVTV